MTHIPPRWAEAWLRLLLPARDREAVSGDLLEQYRDSVRPTRGRLRADAWYIAQVGGFAWRNSRVAVALLLLSFLATQVGGRAANIAGIEGSLWVRFVWLVVVPPAAVLLWAGAQASWSTNRLWAGTAVGFLASFLVTKLLLAGFVVSLAVWQPQLLRFGASWESLRDLTLILVSTTSAGTAIATLGGLAGTLARRSYLGIEP